MRFIAAAFSLVLSAALAAAQSTIVLNTPEGVQECFRTQLTWSGGTGPYQIVVLTGTTIVEDLGSNLTGTSFSWLCKQSANTQIVLRLKDTSTGQTSSTAPFTVLAGDPSLCAAAGSSSAASAPSGSQPAATSPAATSPAASSPAASSPAAPGTTPTPTTAGGSTGTTKPQSSNTKTSSGASSSSTAGAGQLKAPVALAVAAAFAMAVFA